MGNSSIWPDDYLMLRIITAIELHDGAAHMHFISISLSSIHFPQCLLKGLSTLSRHFSDNRFSTHDNWHLSGGFIFPLHFVQMPSMILWFAAFVCLVSWFPVVLFHKDESNNGPGIFRKESHKQTHTHTQNEEKWAFRSGMVLVKSAKSDFRARLEKTMR